MRLIDLFWEMEERSLSAKERIRQEFYRVKDLLDGRVPTRMAVTDGEVLENWKRFFDNGTNWKDFAAGISYEEYKAMTDKQHLRKAKDMPIRFLKASGKGFFVDKEGYALALWEELKGVITEKAFQEQMEDILAYRTMEYYRRRYQRQPAGS